MTQTPYSNKTEILSELWMNYRNDVDFVDFIEYNDLGLPLAFAFASDIATPTEMGTRYVEETFSLLLEALEIEEDTGFETLDDILSIG